MLFLASVGFRSVHAWGRVRQPQVLTLFPQEICGFKGGFCHFSCRELPWDSVGFRRVRVRGSGTATQSANAVFPGNIRNTGVVRGPFLASLSFRGLPACPCRGRVRRPKGLTLNFQVIFGFYGVYDILSSVSIRGLPVYSCKGVGYGKPQS